jgi:hypothetical protein
MPARIASLTVLNTLVEVDTFKRPWSMEPFARRGLGQLYLRALTKPAAPAREGRIRESDGQAHCPRLGADHRPLPPKNHCPYGLLKPLFRTAGSALPAEVTREWRFPAHRSASVHAATIPPPRGVSGIALLAELL